MANKVKPELSGNNPHHISKHRYYELKHFCLQYSEWKRDIKRLDAMEVKALNPSAERLGNSDLGNPTEKIARARTRISRRIEMLEECSTLTDSYLGSYILEGVTNGYSYETIKARLEIPCCRDVYYELYRKFFWVLHKLRD